MKRSLQLMPSGDFAATFLKGNTMLLFAGLFVLIGVMALAIVGGSLASIFGFTVVGLMLTLIGLVEFNS